MRINEKRLWNHIQTLGQIGKAEDGSVTRLSFTKEDEADGMDAGSRSSRND